MSKLKRNRTALGAVEQYGKLGYGCLILWNDEMDTEDLLGKITNFLEVV